MNAVKTLMVGALGAAICILALCLVNIKLEDFSVLIRLAAVVLSAVALGMCLGFFFDRRWHKAIGTGKLIGTFIIWLPLVVATYGLALIAQPILVAYAWLVQMSARLGTRFRV